MRLRTPFGSIERNRHRPKSAFCFYTQLRTIGEMTVVAAK